MRLIKCARRAPIQPPPKLRNRDQDLAPTDMPSRSAASTLRTARRSPDDGWGDPDGPRAQLTGGLGALFMPGVQAALHARQLCASCAS